LKLHPITYKIENSYLLCFLFNKIREEVGTGSAWQSVGRVAQTMYTHVSKCKNDKIKGEEKKKDNSVKLYFHKRFN
jgi:hypothetical protein